MSLLHLFANCVYDVLGLSNCLYFFAHFRQDGVENLQNPLFNLIDKLIILVRICGILA